MSPNTAIVKGYFACFCVEETELVGISDDRVSFPRVATRESAKPVGEAHSVSFLTAGPAGPSLASAHGTHNVSLSFPATGYTPPKSSTSSY
jgi:hypothetical protein